MYFILNVYRLVSFTYTFVKGLSMPVLGAMVENATLFLVYNQSQSFIRSVMNIQKSEKLSLSQLGLAGGLAGGVTSFVL